jgi:hypothetical protein
MRTCADAPLRKGGPPALRIRGFGGLLEPRYVVGAAPLDQ